MGKSKKHEKKSKKHKQRKDRKEKKKKSKKSMEEKTNPVKVVTEKKAEEEEETNFDIPIELMNNKSHAPQTPAEYQKRQSHIRRVTDPETGRIRLIRGDGEVLEEIVGKERHRDINKAATQSDGRFFQKKSIRQSKTKEK